MEDGRGPVARMVTLGVEEEYLLLDAETALPVPKAPQILAAAGLNPMLSCDEVQNELLQAQVEVATPVCAELDEVEDHVRRFRLALAAAADGAGCRVAAAGAAPVAGRRPVPVTDKPRYRMMLADAAHLVEEQLICGMHIHVAIPDRAAGVLALGRIRPWLPVLVAMGANSPLWEGGDTGFASWRTVVFGRWPVSGPPPGFRDAADYEARVRALLATGVIRDRGQLYWQARLSERYPTLEVRALDVQLRAGTAVMFAGIVRALVVTALRESGGAAPFVSPEQEIVHAAGWHAARHGLNDVLVDPHSGRPRPAREVVESLLEHLTPALDEAGDTVRVTSSVHRLLDQGTGAALQREAMSRGGLDSVVELIAPLPKPGP
ncbi:MAG: ybdK 2 [Streptomyces oryziradicis]|nr:ybdK 2 [Actinacidiphila oryziradicis]